MQMWIPWDGRASVSGGSRSGRSGPCGSGRSYAASPIGGEYVKRSEAEYTEQVRERLEKQLKRRAKELGFEAVTADPPAATATRCQSHRRRGSDGGESGTTTTGGSDSPTESPPVADGLRDDGHGLPGEAKTPGIASGRRRQPSSVTGEVPGTACISGTPVDRPRLARLSPARAS